MIIDYQERRIHFEKTIKCLPVSELPYYAGISNYKSPFEAAIWKTEYKTMRDELSKGGNHSGAHFGKVNQDEVMEYAKTHIIHNKVITPEQPIFSGFLCGKPDGITDQAIIEIKTFSDFSGCPEDLLPVYAREITHEAFIQALIYAWIYKRPVFWLICYFPDFRDKESGHCLSLETRTLYGCYQTQDYYLLIKKILDYGTATMNLFNHGLTPVFDTHNPRDMQILADVARLINKDTRRRTL